MDHGDGMPVACPLVGRRQERKRERRGIGLVTLASNGAGRAWDCGTVRRELGRPAGCVAERLAGSGATDLSGAGLADVQLSPRRGDTTVWRRIRDNRNARNVGSAGIFRDRNASISGHVGGLSTVRRVLLRSQRTVRVFDARFRLVVASLEPVAAGRACGGRDGYCSGNADRDVQL
jgi:hypothetical protein